MFKLIFPIVFIVLIINCQSPTENSINQFSSNEDRLLVKTQRIMGTEPFEFGAMPISFKDTTALFDFPIKYPNGLSKIKGFRLSVDLKNPMDFIDIINGKMDDMDVIIVDQNNNEDFTDDEILKIQPIDWNSSENSIPVEFQILNKSDTLRNSSWIRVGTDNDVFLYAKDEHLEAKIFIDEEMYRIGVFDQEARVSFNYGAKPIIALLSDSNKDDNLKASESFKIGEYINLNGIYYRFDSISNNGEFITLLKENDFENKVGTQVGMIAPEFIYKSVSGHRIKTDSLHDRPLIIANSCGCGGDKKSTQAFLDIKETYKDQIYALRLDSGIDKINDWNIDMNEDFNKDAYDKFRQAYCSRICYIIGENRRVLGKFEITDWKSFLPKYLSDN